MAYSLTSLLQSRRLSIWPSFFSGFGSEVRTHADPVAFPVEGRGRDARGIVTHRTIPLMIASLTFPNVILSA